MGKKVLIANCLLIATMSLLSVTARAQELGRIMSIFQSKDAILEWSKKEFGYSVRDTISFNVEDWNFFVLCGDYGSGIPRKAVYIFSNNSSEEKEEWGLFCWRNTNTSEVSVELDQNRKEVVLKAKSGKSLMILPFESLNLYFDKSEH